jgi:hypothetical protein
VIPSDRANPQSPGTSRLATRVVGVAIEDGLRMVSTVRPYFKLVGAPAGTGPQHRMGAGYHVAAHIAAATPAGPAGFYARLRAVRGVES